MKDMNKLINTVLIAVTVIVAVIFVVGVFKNNDPVTRTDQSSMSDEVNHDDLTNKYIKELQGKLKQEEKDAKELMRKAQQIKPAVKPRDEDWRQVPVEQQISRDQAVEVQKSDRGTAGSVNGATTITKENATEFIATARKNGYHVILSPTYEVISVTPIMNTRNVDESFETHPAE
jgi:LAS superfamily LD-carboxypeptidase LdcB